MVPLELEIIQSMENPPLIGRKRKFCYFFRRVSLGKEKIWKEIRLVRRYSRAHYVDNYYLYKFVRKKEATTVVATQDEILVAIPIKEDKVLTKVEIETL